jgi:SAM-dependent methyltransferase
MHDTARINAERFFHSCVPIGFRGTIVEVGSRDINGSLRDLAPAAATYIGVDTELGLGVDVVATNPYSLPLPDAHADLVLCSSTLEHCEFPWALFLELCRIAKPSALIYCCAPSQGPFHPCPIDAWRFYPDCAAALQHWALLHAQPVSLVRTYISIFDNPVDTEYHDEWRDWVAIYRKETAA